jgi:CRISPR-associated endonuclease/helicase Cas3
MAVQVTIKILPQFVETTDKVFDSQRLHSIQAAMLEYDALAEVVILTAPTGTGKSFSFPFPVLASKRRGGLSQMRCIVVSPTNALIEDMQREYSKKFPELKTEVLNRKKLDSLNAHGLKRWDEILDIIRDNDIVITNPDLLNWAMFGGYSFTNKQPHVGRLLDKIDYIVFDEYHLYDEEQIANIITWMILKRSLLPAKAMKFIFASATPEPALVGLLKGYKFEVQELCESITDHPSPTARQIHGEITVIFRKVEQASGEPSADEAVGTYLFGNREQVEKYAKRGDKILVMVDRMVSLRKMRQRVREVFTDFVVAEESGYLTKSGRKEDTASANVILATNKVEVGVNLNVRVCLMPPGRHFTNFVQRLGRVARGNMNGIVVVFIERIEQLREALHSSETLSYYDFIDRCRAVEMLSDRLFYLERVPRYLGAFFFIIQERTLKDYAAKQMFKKNLNLEGYEGETRLMFHTFRVIHQSIFQDLRHINKTTRGYSWELKCIRDWWVIFLGTFRYFRSGAPSLKFIDMDFDKGMQIQEYSLEWVLANRFITGEKSINGERCLEVSGFRTEKNELQFVVDSFPFGKLNEEHRYLSQQERWNIRGAFQKRVKLCMAEWQRRSQDDFSKAVVNLIVDLSKLSMVFSQKRLLVTDIKEYSNFIE